MFTTPEQFSAAAKANFEAQIAAISGFTTQAFENVAKIVDLNLNVAKNTFDESKAAAQLLLAAKDPQEFFKLSAAQAQPSAEKALEYGRSLAGIATSTQAEFTKAAEAQIAETNRKVIELVDSVSKNAPAGSEPALALVKSAIGNVNASYDQLSKTAKQAAEALEANVTSAVSQFTATATKASRAKK
jgi:phasin family protein